MSHSGMIVPPFLVSKLCPLDFFSQKILHTWSLQYSGTVAKYKRSIFKGFNSLQYLAGLNMLKVDCF